MYTGYQLCELVRKLIKEDSGSSFLDDFLTYQFLNDAAMKTVQKSGCLTGSQSITTVADQTTYDLNTDFLRLFMKDSDGYKIVKYSDGTSTVFLKEQTYEDLYYANNTTSVTFPTRFAVKNKAQDSNVTGSATAAGTKSHGQCTLTSSTSTFVTSGVEAGDVIYNTTDQSNGIVLSVTSETALVTALFDGTNNDWTSSDAFVIVPQGRSQVVLDPPPSEASDTITVAYVKRPPVVYSDYGTFGFSQNLSLATAYYAAWLYKYRGQEPDFGNAWYQFWIAEVTRNSDVVRNVRGYNKLRVSFKRRS